MSKPPKMAPHLIVKGGVDAIKFYEDALDADTQFLMMAEDGKRVMHAALEINDSIIYLCDDFSDNGAKPAKSKAAATAPATVMIHLQLKKPKHVDATMQQAVDHGAEIVFPAEDAFWGDRYGQIRDPFGHVWSFGAALKHKDQMQAAMMDKEAAPPAKTSTPKGRKGGSKT
jgi:PhnB protein